MAGVSPNSSRSIWITGISNAGKTTLGKLLVESIRAQGTPCVLVDGNEMRELFPERLGFELAARRQQTERVRKLVAWLSSQGIHSVVALIHPVEEDRRRCRETVAGYFQVHLNCPVDEARRRDTRHVYDSGNGPAANVVGVDIPFEGSDFNDLEFRSDQHTPEQIRDQVLGSL